METFGTYVRRTIDEAVKIGTNSLTLVTIVSTFIGAVTTIQTAANMVSPFIPDSVISTIVREMTVLELAPTITSIILAGKVGSSIAGELGTMRISEQIDALEVMGINSASYLVLPKLIAALTDVSAAGDRRRFSIVVRRVHCRYAYGRAQRRRFYCRTSVRLPAV